MNELKFNSQVCTTKEQSQRLLEMGLKPETADMVYAYEDTFPYSCYLRVLYNGDYISSNIITEDIPAWSLHRLIELYKDVEDTSMWSLENVNYNRLIQCIRLAIKHGAFNREYLKR